MNTSRERRGITFGKAGIFALALSVNGVDSLAWAPTSVKRSMQFGNVRLDTPGLGDRNAEVVLEANGTTPTVSLLEAVAFDEPSHDRPLPIGASVGPFNGDTPTEPQGNLRGLLEVLPQGPCVRTFSLEVLLELLCVSSWDHVIAT